MAAGNRLAITPVVASAARGRLSFGFKGITDAIGGEVTVADDGEIRLAVVAVPFGPVWDRLFHTAAQPQPGPDGAPDPLFEPFATWINDEVARADSLALWTRAPDASVFDGEGTARPAWSAPTAQRAKLLPAGVRVDAGIGAEERAWKLLACLPVRLPGHGGWRG